MEFVHTSYLLKGNEAVHTDLKGLLKGLSVESVYTLYLWKGNLKGNLYTFCRVLVDICIHLLRGLRKGLCTF